tara:strand:+ start:613 stop:756 length:144 start_codon:yes stop_codon:yes gene_type:complete
MTMLFLRVEVVDGLPRIKANLFDSLEFQMSAVILECLVEIRVAVVVG